MYGYVTATRIKVVVILRDDYDRVSDTDVRGLFRELHGHFVEASSNPFGSLGESLSSARFDRNLRTTVKVRNRTWFVAGH